MQGLELSRRYYEEFGKPMLEQSFPHLLPLIAAGLCGSGSECFGFDDELSQDHDFEPGFCLFLPSEDLVSRRDAFLLERAYSRLPDSFAGFQRLQVSPAGGNRHGVIRISDFLTEKTGEPDGVLSVRHWVTIPSYSLAEVTNGEIYRDDSGVFTETRKRLSRFPEEIRRKRLAGNLLSAAQSGQYAYRRCIGHGETGAAQLAVTEFVRGTMQASFLLCQIYQPYYKWGFRAMRTRLPAPFSGLADSLEYLLTTDNAEEAETKRQVMEDIARILSAESANQGLCRPDLPLAESAYEVDSGIRDPEIRTLHILSAVSSF
ncbi:MAG: DUF4037 domain-containing protein [Clostridia bacterium]|nr:DUF4037 domain-containing protein [Clostridia bacterium]